MVLPKRLVNGTALSTSWASLYTAPTSITATAKQLVICNTDSTARTFYYAVTPSSSAPTTHDSTIMFNGLSVSANTTSVFGLTDIIPTGYSIQAKAGESGAGNYLNVTVSGMEVS